MESILAKAILSVQRSELSFSKFIKSNDVGATGAHQSGFHIPKNSWSVFFETEGRKGSNKDKFITIKWQDDFETHSRFIYYGVGTRNEYRLTRFGRDFPYLTDDNIGNLLVICRRSSDYFEAFVLKSDDDIDEFFAAFNFSSNDTNGIIPKQFEFSSERKILTCFNEYLKSLIIDFPTTIDLATRARNCYNSSYGITSSLIKSNPDNELLNWIDAEFQLFKIIENDRYQKRIQTQFKTVEELVEVANTILNRRKSRAGKSLEHHLTNIFTEFNLRFKTQVVTEDNKKPDFLFPGEEAYYDLKYPEKNLFMLASKTTCKDRWRQILNEADRIKTKHLFTLQQGISSNQLKEMYKSNICLVVPAAYQSSFPKEYQPKILSLNSFTDYIRKYQK